MKVITHLILGLPPMHCVDVLCRLMTIPCMSFGCLALKDSYHLSFNHPIFGLWVFLISKTRHLHYIWDLLFYNFKKAPCALYQKSTCLFWCIHSNDYKALLYTSEFREWWGDAIIVLGSRGFNWYHLTEARIETTIIFSFHCLYFYTSTAHCMYVHYR